MYRAVTPKDFEGKTIEHADTWACNTVVLTFSDGTKLKLDTVRITNGLYAIAVWETEKR